MYANDDIIPFIKLFELEIMRETKDIIRAWLNTKALNKIGKELEYSSHSTIADSKCSFDFRQYLNDIEMSAVNSAMNDLKEDDLEGHAVIENYYKYSLSCTRQARILGRRTEHIVSMLKEAENFIRGSIYKEFRRFEQ